MKTEELQKWIGKTEERTDVLTSFPATALAATLNHKELNYSKIKIYRHYGIGFIFCQFSGYQRSGYDGHAALGDFLPPVPLPRRMWAGSRIKFLSPLKLGNEYKNQHN